MITIKMHSWDLHQQTDGSVMFFVHRHDGSLLPIPMAPGKTPGSSATTQFLCIEGQYSGYAGFVDAQWVPQP